jgi:PAS domain S-box-containing protein
MTDISQETVDKWQGIVNLIAKMARAPAALVMRVEPPEIVVFRASAGPGNPYRTGERARLETGLYCETVMRERKMLLVPDALADPLWKDNPDVKLGMISYLGLPLAWPDGKIFGTICLLDLKANAQDQQTVDLLSLFRGIIEDDLRQMHATAARMAEIEAAREILQETNRTSERSRLALLNVLEDEKQTELALKRQEKKYRTLVEGMNEGLIQVDNGDVIIFVNQRFCQISGYPRQELIGKVGHELLFDPADREVIRRKNLDRLVGKTGSYEIKLRCRDGQERWVYVSGTPVTGPDGTVAGSIGTFTDISERKQAEQQILLNQKRLESLVTILQADSENVQHFLDFALDEAIHLTGSKIGYIYYYSEERKEFTLNTWSKEVMPQCTVANPQSIYQLEKTGIWGKAVRQRKPIMVNDFKASHTLKKGQPEGHAPLHKSLTVPVFAGGRIVAVVGVANKEVDYDQSDVLQLTILMDSVWKVTDRKRAEEKLRESENNYRTLADSGQALVWTAGTDKLCNYFNKVWLEFTGRPLEQEMGNGWAEGVHSDDLQRCLEIYTAAFDRRENFSMEYRLRRHDGEYRWIRDDGSPRYNGAGEFVGYIGHCLDITERHKAEQQINASLKEKEVLLKEIHHRVKNNLQIIASLLNLQTGYVDDPHYKKMFMESQNRVRSMALVHEKLYRSKDLSGIDFSEYVNSMMRDIYSSYGLTQGEVALSLDVTREKLPVDIAIPCGLLINELVSNSFKYAFKDKKGEGKIGISFQKDNAGTYTLEVSDNGSGISTGLDLKTVSTLGLQLVDSLVGQLDASIRITGEGGTKVTIKFKA